MIPSGSIWTTPLIRMHTLGHDFVPAPLHAGGLRYHGMAPSLCALYDAGYIEAKAVPQLATFEAAVTFSRTEGILPAPESAHAIRGAIDEALDVTRIYSILDQLPDGTPLLQHRPFRAPHHTISHAGLVGGGNWPQPGEISLAHRGVLFGHLREEATQDRSEASHDPAEETAVGRDAHERPAGGELDPELPVLAPVPAGSPVPDQPNLEVGNRPPPARHEAGDRQVADARVGFTCNFGGFGNNVLALTFMKEG